jgi:hypothetical protein
LALKTRANIPNRHIIPIIPNIQYDVIVNSNTAIRLLSRYPTGLRPLAMALSVLLAEYLRRQMAKQIIQVREIVFVALTWMIYFDYRRLKGLGRFHCIPVAPSIVWWNSLAKDMELI